VNLTLTRATPPPDLKSHVLQGGHSGADVVLFTNDADTFVRKGAQRTTGSARLLKQAVKQRLFAAQGLGFPHVRDMGVDKTRRAWFEMDYVPARTLGDLVRSQSPFCVGRVIARIAELLVLFRTTQTDALQAALFHTKIREVTSAARTNPAAATDLPRFLRVAGALGAMDWSGIPASVSHGDLTFDNILVDADGHVTFIDCDEAFASSWWLDVGKLFQDIAGRWCLRATMAQSVGACERLAQLETEVLMLASALDPALPPKLLQFAALHLLRTIPYSRTEATVAFATRAAARLLEIDP
jgi:aminoglycoside phosphotransferase